MISRSRHWQEILFPILCNREPFGIIDLSFITLNIVRYTEEKFFEIWAASWQNQQNVVCAQRRLRSAWASAQADQSLRCLISLGICPGWSEFSLSAWIKLGSLATHWAHSEGSDQTGRMLYTESSLGAQSFCWFCHEAAHLWIHWRTRLVSLWHNAGFDITSVHKAGWKLVHIDLEVPNEGANRTPPPLPPPQPLHHPGDFCRVWFSESPFQIL